MAPTITVIRTAEALHNINATSNFLTRDQLEKLNFGYDLPDPYLTSAGLMQCADASVRLGEELAKEPDPVLNFVVTAPSKRAIQTALLCVAPSIERLGSITIHRALRPPNPTHGCNQIASRDDLDKEFGNLINSHFVDEEEPGVAGPDAMLPENVEERARGFRAWLQDICKRASAELPDSSIYVVADVEFIVYLTGDFVSGYMWDRCSSRSYQFVDSNLEDRDARLWETDESFRKRNGKMRAPPADQAFSKSLIDSSLRRQHTASKAEIKTVLLS